MEIKKDNDLDIDGKNNIGIVDNIGSIVINTYNTTQKSIDKFLNLVPQYDYRKIIDRIDITSDIHKFLIDTTELVILSGVGGIGKTTIALAYCNNPEITKYYDHIAWVTITEDLQSNLMNKLSNDETGFRYFEELSKQENFYNCISILSKIKGTNLLIIDNANNPKELIQNKGYLESLRWKVLITSRTKPDECKIIDINELEYQHCKDLFLRYYKKKDIEDNILKSLFEKINYHTLLTELLAKAGNKNHLLNTKKITELIQKQDNLKEPLLQNRITISNPQATQKEIEKEFKLYDYIIAIFDIENLSDVEKDYLKYFSVLPYIEISFDDLKDFFQIPDEQIVDFSDILDDLVKKGWLMQNILQNDDNVIVTFKCHQLIQTVLREKLDISANSIDVLILSFIEKIKDKSGINWLDKKPYIVFVESLISNIKVHSFNYSILLREYAIFQNNLGLYDNAILYSEKAYELMQKFKDLNKLELAKTCKAIGLCYASNGKYEIALNYRIQAKEMLENSNEFPIIELGKTYRAIANNYRNLAEYELSISYHIKAIDIFKYEISDDFQIELASSYDNLGFTYSAMKQYEQSLEYRLLSFELRKKYLQELHPSYSASLNNIGALYSKLNQLDKALEFHLKSLQNRINNFGDFHPSLAYAYNNLTDVFRKLRNFDKAIECGQKAGNILEGILHKNHPRISNYQYYLTETYFDKKELDKAIKFAEKSFEIRSKIFKPEHFTFVNSLILLKKIKFALLEQEYWNFRREIKLTPDITPVNLQTEKEYFLTILEKNERYNPIFQYEINDNFLKLKQFENFLNKFSNTDFYLTELYKQTISDDIDWITNFNQRSVNFQVWLSSIHSKPSEDVYQKALDIVNTFKEIKSSEKTINAEQAKEFMISKLVDCGYDWKVEIINNSAKMSVNSLLQTIKIKDTAMFTEQELQRLFVHEIETHILRNENGKSQRYEMFSIGLPDYVATEEGLAILAEQLNNLRDETDEIRYALRVVLCYKCFEMDFWDLFKYANQYFDKDIAFDMVARVKRGLIETSQFGGYTKDQVYFTGYHQVKDLPKEILKKLYIGKIGIQYLELISKFDDLNYNVRIPHWIENINNSNTDK